jgi:hypothetical protein
MSFFKEVVFAVTTLAVGWVCVVMLFSVGG